MSLFKKTPLTLDLAPLVDSMRKAWQLDDPYPAVILLSSHMNDGCLVFTGAAYCTAIHTSKLYQELGQEYYQVKSEKATTVYVNKRRIASGLSQEQLLMNIWIPEVCYTDMPSTVSLVQAVDGTSTPEQNFKVSLIRPSTEKSLTGSKFAIIQTMDKTECDVEFLSILALCTDYVPGVSDSNRGTTDGAFHLYLKEIVQYQLVGTSELMTVFPSRSPRVIQNGSRKEGIYRIIPHRPAFPAFAKEIT